MPAGHAASLRAFADRNTALSDPAPALPQLGQISRGSRRYPATQQIRRPVTGPEGRAERPSHGHCRRGHRHCLRPSAGVELFRAYLRRRPELVDAARRELAGRDLTCGSKPHEECNADELLRIAAGGKP